MEVVPPEPSPQTPQQISSEGQLQLGQVNFSRNRITRVPLRLVATGIASDSSGNIATMIGLNNPTATSNWAGYAVLYDQYRIKSCTISTIPDNDATTIAFRPLYFVTDYDSNTISALTSADVCIQYQNTRVYDITKPIVHKTSVPRYVNPTTPMGWLDVANATSNGYTAIIAFNLTASIQYLAAYSVEWDVEFRSSR